MFSRRALAVVVLAAFAMQGIVTQSHSHWGGRGQKAPDNAFQVVAGVGLTGGVAADSKQTPAKGGDTRCPICHVVSIAGAFFVSASPILRLPSLSTLVPRRDERSVVVERFTTAWRSRAPPSV